MLKGQEKKRLFKHPLIGKINRKIIAGCLYLFYTDDFAYSDVQSGWDDLLIICGLFRVALRSSFYESTTIKLCVNVQILPFTKTHFRT